jgi:glycosyltransferase involved in cell wall biosynthesis
MPSAWEETAGLAAIEQMMLGKLVIVSDIGGLGEIVNDSRLKVRPGDAQALAGVIGGVLEQPALIDTFGRRARDRALRLFKRQRMVEYIGPWLVLRKADDRNSRRFMKID